MSHPLNDVVWCRLAPSPIHGIGVFAIRDIPEGTELAGGVEDYSRDGEADVLPEIHALMQDQHCFLEYFDVLPNPNRNVHLQCFMNHSDTPNSNGKVALRDIRKGEEVTENFKTFDRMLGPKAAEHYSFLTV